MSFGHSPQRPMQPSNTNINANPSAHHPITTPIYTRTRLPSSQSRSSISAPPSPSIRTRAQSSNPHPQRDISSINSTPSSSSASPVSYPYQTTSTTFQHSQPHSASPSSPSPLVFDMKRLLAKPAPPYARSHYGYGSGSESEGGYSFSDSGAPSAKSAQARRDPEREHEKEKILREISFDKGSPLDLSFEVAAGPPHDTMTAFRTRSESEHGHTAEPTKNKRVRNVLKRRPSTNAVASLISMPKLNPTTPLLSPLPPLAPRSPLTPSIMMGVPPGRPATAPTPGTPTSHMLSVPSKMTTSNPRSPTTPMSRTASSMTMKNNDRRDDSKTSNIPSSPNIPSAMNDPRGTTTTNYATEPSNSMHPNLSPHPPSHRSRSSSRHSPDPRLSTPHLTPAGAVVEAYKRQEEARRTAAAATDNSNHHKPSGHNADDDQHAYTGSRLMPSRPAYHSHSPYGSMAASASASESGVSLGLLSMTTSTDAEDAYGGMETGFDIIERVVGAQHQHHYQHRSDPTPAAEEEEAKAPYYTIFGSSSERVVAVGSAEDRYHSMYVDASGLGRHASASATAAGKAGTGGSKAGGGGLAKTLSRKVSGRWRRGAGGVEMGAREREDADRMRRGVSMSVERGGERELEKEKDRGRPSLQERRTGRLAVAERDRSAQRSQKQTTSVGHSDRGSLRLSINKFMEETVPPSPIKSTESEPAVGGGRQPPRLKAKKSDPGSSASPASGSSPGANGSGSGGGSKIWKLVKRISTGGLREKYTSFDAPPVPALPKEYSASSTGPLMGNGGPRLAEHHQHHKEASVALATPSPPMSRFMPSRSSSTGAPRVAGIVRRKSSQVLAGASPPTKTPPHSRPHASSSSSSLPQPPQSPVQATSAAARAAPSRPSPSNSNTRPSATTRSSSPNSSDVASSRFFSGYSHRQSSARSSASSLFGDDDPPPMPKLNVGQHIIPPSELGKMHSEDGHSGVAEANTSLVNAKPVHQKLKLVLPGTSFPTRTGALRPSDDWMIVHTPSVELASLPFPPRRPRPQQDARIPTPGSSNSSTSDLSMSIRSVNDERDHEVDRAGSPIIPSFSAASPINSFTPSKRMSSDTRRSRPSPPVSAGAGTSPSYQPSQSSPLSAPPPRPSRSSQRPPPAPMSVNSESKSMPTSPANTFSSYGSRRVPVPPYDPALIPRTPTSPNANRHSTSAQSTTSTATARPALLRRRSSSATSLSSPPRRTMMFRELGKAEALTEQEKAKRWEDLLERSAQAGGTLHLGGGGGEDGLRSDRLRFSEISEVL
ncbi:hypothetical protein Hypma_003526 [Hypsizygus marmoreus]|uniref:Uncharacterized protein n=1 Tax=Hypsizygus marmoreus TaxID=39966 RepID=A0A369J1R0_HYPMA|nr:hypothetical protein Hypma_003526 [Hypsizygus marmoreus]